MGLLKKLSLEVGTWFALRIRRGGRGMGGAELSRSLCTLQVPGGGLPKDRIPCVLTENDPMGLRGDL